MRRLGHRRSDWFGILLRTRSRLRRRHRIGPRLERRLRELLVLHRLWRFVRAHRFRQRIKICGPLVVRLGRPVANRLGDVGALQRRRTAARLEVAAYGLRGLALDRLEVPALRCLGLGFDEGIGCIWRSVVSGPMLVGGHSFARSRPFRLLCFFRSRIGSGRPR
jgi:hypothetical protein